jgi:hypothetical protein
MEYGVNVSNKFAFLGDDEDAHDPAEILAKAEQAREMEKLAPKTAVKKSVTTGPTKNVTIAPQSAVNANKENIDGHRTQQRRDKDRRGPPRNGQRGPRRDDNITSGDVISERFGESRPPRQPRGPPREDGGNRGRRNEGGQWQHSDRGPRGPRNDHPAGENNAVLDGDQQNNRPANGRPQRGLRNGPKNDRTSGSDKTGVRSVAKKDGFGKGNWGTEKDALAGETEGTEQELNKSVTNADSTNWDASENANENHADSGANENQTEEEEKIRELTLEEWRAQQKSEKPNFNVRQAGEGGDQKVYKNLVLVKPVEKEQNNAEEEEETNHKREKREKLLNIEVSFSDSNRNRGGFRGDDRRDYRNNDRGDRRSGAGYGGDRGDRGNRQGGFNGRRNDGPGGSGTQRQQQPAGFNLANDFPALGAR